MSLNDPDFWYTYPHRTAGAGTRCYVSRERLRRTRPRDVRWTTCSVIEKDLDKLIELGIYRVDIEYTPEVPFTDPDCA